MYGQAARKKAERQRKEAEAAKRCVCGNFNSGHADKLCNSCRSAKDKPTLATSVSTAAPKASAPPPRKAGTAGPPRTREEAARSAVAKGCPQGMEAEIVEHLAEMAADLLADAAGDDVRDELLDLLSPFLEDESVSSEGIAGFCDEILRQVAAVSKGTSPDSSTAAPTGKLDVVEVDLVCRVKNLLLMYGGSPEPLLKDTTMELFRGQRYGVIGANGSGKTTLITRIAEKTITGFPQTLRLVQLRHDKLLDGVGPTTSVKEYMCKNGVGGADETDALAALVEVGFDSASQDQLVLSLSGGWQMRLALACAVAQKVDLLLLDEPTNHLDTAGVRWLVSWINKTCVGGDNGSTAMIVSHDQEFLDEVCTSIIHFSARGKLEYHPGNFATFKSQQLFGDEAKASELLETATHSSFNRMAFPAPENIGDRTVSKKGTATFQPPPVVTLQNTTFRYSEGASAVLSDVNVQVTMSSRIGIVGKNGCGKSTLLSLLAGRLQPGAAGNGSFGELWWYKGLRLAYIGQHSMTHLGDHLERTPLAYIQLRFHRGYDCESFHVVTAPGPSKKEEKRLQENGARHGKMGKNVEALVSRISSSKGEGKEKETEMLYEVKWKDLASSHNSFEKLSRLRTLGVAAMAAELDENLANAWGEHQPRPLTTREVVQHLELFGLSEDVICNRQISMLSSGQKSKLVFGGAFWTRPQLLCLDEPTNYLDIETVDQLQRAIKSFRGGAVIVTHSDSFVENVCNEVWELEDGKVAVRMLAK